MDYQEDTNEHLILLIHGTFASNEPDEGTGWWQRGSSVWCQLKKRLPPEARLMEEGDLFHWSGCNSERERKKAALNLFNLLKQLEVKQQPYHLIGHSHGGLVIWGALCEAERTDYPLPHLKSWATVGTPFLHFEPKRSRAIYEPSPKEWTAS